MIIFHALFSKEVSGSERYLASLAQEQIKAGHTVHVLIRRQKQSPNITDYLPEEVILHTLPKRFKKLRLWLLLRCVRPDAIHTHLGKAGRLLGKIKGRTPCVATLHVKYKRKDFKRHDGLICLTAAQQQKLPEKSTAQTTVIPCWVENLREVSPTEIETHRQNWQADDQTLVVGSICRLHPHKGLDTLINAFKAANLTNSQLILAGVGKDEARLQALAAGDARIQFVGYQKDVAPFYHAFDVFVSTSLSETFGLTFLEAMQTGCPLIATATDGAKACLQNQPAALIPVQDVAALADALTTVHKQGRKRAQYNIQNFAPDHCCQQIEAFYKSFKA